MYPLKASAYKIITVRAWQGTKLCLGCITGGMTFPETQIPSVLFLLGELLQIKSSRAKCYQELYCRVKASPPHPQPLIFQPFYTQGRFLEHSDSNPSLGNSSKWSVSESLPTSLVMTLWTLRHLKAPNAPKAVAERVIEAHRGSQVHLLWVNKP